MTSLFIKAKIHNWTEYEYIMQPRLFSQIWGIDPITFHGVKSNKLYLSPVHCILEIMLLRTKHVQVPHYTKLHVHKHNINNLYLVKDALTSYLGDC